MIDADDFEFPSPYGDFVFQLSARARGFIEAVAEVSVPLRGFCFSTRNARCTLRNLMS